MPTTPPLAAEAAPVRPGPAGRRRLLLPIGLGGVVGLGLGFWAGPRPEVDATLRPVELPADPRELAAWLERSEDAVGDVQPWARKTIRWADPGNPRPTDVAVVYLHGFSATHREVAPLAEEVADALGANLFAARLRGHGRRDPEALGRVAVNDWLQDGAEALAVGRRLGRRVVVMATSTGATLATWLVSTPAGADVDALVLLSPNYRLRDPKAAFLGWPWGGRVAQWVLGPRRSFEPSSPSQARYWTTSYPTSALVTLAGLMQLADAVDPRDVAVPVLALVDPEDRVISPEAVVERVAGFPHPASRVERLASEDPSHHVIAGDALSPGTTGEVAERALGFLREVLEPTPAAGSGGDS